ncbi:uncharacterized protein LOC118437146 [Folsomia candida]|uniref:uncharacterized protein LOC118437146 n=1 Tax=Folsomia candida TaxID=158441 RepID=UPI001604F0F1|nr:uncharacterized protein LOC118437146 [Folsomia candida]
MSFSESSGSSHRTFSVGRQHSSDDDDDKKVDSGRNVFLDDGEKPCSSSLSVGTGDDELELEVGQVLVAEPCPLPRNDLDDEDEEFFRTLRRTTFSDEAVASSNVTDKDLLEQHGIQECFIELRQCDDPGWISSEDEKKEEETVEISGNVKNNKRLNQQEKKQSPAYRTKSAKSYAAYEQRQIEENEEAFREKRTRRLSLYREKQIEENEEEFRQKVRSASAKYIKKQLELDPDFLKNRYKQRKERRKTLTGEDLAELRRKAILRIDQSTLNLWLGRPAYSQFDNSPVNFNNYLATLSTVELIDSKYSDLVSDAFLQKKSYCNYWVGGFKWDDIEKLSPAQIEAHVIAHKDDPDFLMNLYWGYYSNGQRSAVYHPRSPSSTVWKMLEDGWRCFELNIFNCNIANFTTLSGDTLRDAIKESDAYAHRLEGFGIKLGMLRNDEPFDGMRVQFMNTRKETVSAEDEKDARRLALAKFIYFDFEGEEEQKLPEDSLLQQLPKFKLGKEIKKATPRQYFFFLFFTTNGTSLQCLCFTDFSK